MTSKPFLPLFLAPALTLSAADWPTWGGSPERNMVNDVEKNIATSWDVDSKANVKWVAQLGSQSYGNPVIADGKIYVGTNNEGAYDSAIEGDKGNILCFNEADGKFLWQAVHDKLDAGRVNDWPLQGICSTVAVEGNRIWYVNNRCEVICADAEGLADGKNDGVQDEKYKDDSKADIIWRFDMIEELGVFPHNLATSSPLILGDLVIVVTGNGVDEGHLNLPSPTSPSFLALNKKTGEWVWEYAVEGKVLHGQWSSAAYGKAGDQEQVVFPGGDGWIYSLNPKDGSLIWRFDMNPKDSEWELGGYGTRNNIISTPVILNDHVYIGVGQDPEHGTGIGHFYKIDATGKGDVTGKAAKWHIGNKDFGRTMSTVAVKDGLVYAAELAGFLHCIDDATGKIVWTHDLEAAVWGSPVAMDGKIYIGDEDGDITILALGRTHKEIAEINMGATVYTSPTAANGVLYIATKSKLYAIEKKD